jgi:archaellum component FlaF (FlaF/FlaG flagellin family)
MGAGTIIATAIAITLLIIILIGGTLTTARVVALAQQAAADREAEKLNTRIEIFSATTNVTDARTYIEVNNTGSMVIRDFSHMDVYLIQGGIPHTYTNLPAQWNWTYSISPDAVNPMRLDPDETTNITISYNQALGDPTWVKVTTANGVFASKYAVIV